VIDLERLIRSDLDRLVALPSGERADWQDVLERAGLSRRGPGLSRQRLAYGLALAIAALAVAVATPVGGAIVREIGHFSGWLRGDPGKPASVADQQRFRAANGRSWAAFPRTTQLRELIRTDVAGKRYVLYGFRSGSWLCLRLKAISLGHSTAPACAAASTLAHAAMPIVVVDSNDGFDDSHAHPSAQFSFGIASDDVERIDVSATDGVHRAVIGGNAYLWVENEPNTGNRVLSITTTSARKKRATLTLEPSNLFDLSTAPARKAQGPTRVQAPIAHPTIGWLARGEKRGLSPSEARLTPRQRLDISRPHVVGLIKPDPLSDIVVGLSRGCLTVIDGGTSCSKWSEFFARGPLNLTYFGGGFNRSDRFLGVAGAAADGVSRIRIFLADGEQQSAALRDNVFTALIPNQPPIRVVAYNALDQVVGIETFPGFRFGRRSPYAATVNLRQRLRLTAPYGATATLRVGPTVGGVHCWRVAFSTGQAQGACQQQLDTGPQLSIHAVQPAGRDLFVIGRATAAIVRVELRLQNGTLISARPHDGIFLLAIPRSQLSGRRQLAYVTGYDRHGHGIQRQAVLFRSTVQRAPTS
jgi:hypothetical protein